MQHVVIGAGEVGSAIAEVLESGYPGDVHLRDVEPDVSPRADVLHICYPWHAGFAAGVAAYQRAYEPRVTIVHSTVPVGTCDPLEVVHSPVTGRHPDLAASVRTFTKFFGGRQARFAASTFALLGVRTEITELAATTEAAKLWELTQYGLAIVVEKQIHAYCEAHGLDFGVVYAAAARSYNDGYQALGLERFTRPVLAHVPGPIGGHCVVPGAGMLDHWIGPLVAGLGGPDTVEVDIEVSPVPALVI